MAAIAVVTAATAAAVDSVRPGGARRPAVVAAAAKRVGAVRKRAEAAGARPAEAGDRKPALSLSVRLVSAGRSPAPETEAAAATWPVSQSRDPLPILKWRVSEQIGRSQASGDPHPVVNPTRRSCRPQPSSNEEMEMVAV